MSYVMRKSKRDDFYTGIRTRIARSAKTLPHFYLRPKCCLFQYVFSLSRLCSGGFYVLTKQMKRLLISCGFLISGRHDLPPDARVFS